MIRILQVSKSYGLGASRVEALRHVSLEIPDSQFLAITGPSGCGKSTLLHLLGGLDCVTEGEIFLDDQPIHRLDDAGLTELRRHHVGIVFQFFNLLPTLTAEENVQLPALLQGVPEKEASQRARALLDQVGLLPRATHRLAQLSGGEMQRTALARALITRPKLILADEPTGNLDSAASRRVVQLFRELGRQHHTTIVMATHSPEVAAAADRQIEMRDGKIIEK